jgi:hypothetical protein
MNLKGKYEVTHCLTLKALTQGVRDLALGNHPRIDGIQRLKP